MARYTEKRKAEQLGELATMMLLAMHMIEVQCATCDTSELGQGGKSWVPGRSISRLIGGKWTNYRHSIMMQLKADTWIEAWKGYERGSDKKELWRYSLTEAGKVYLAELTRHAAKDCLYITPAQLGMFEVKNG